MRQPQKDYTWRSLAEPFVEAFRAKVKHGTPVMASLSLADWYRLQRKYNITAAGQPASPETGCEGDDGTQPTLSQLLTHAAELLREAEIAARSERPSIRMLLIRAREAAERAQEGVKRVSDAGRESA